MNKRIKLLKNIWNEVQTIERRIKLALTFLSCRHSRLLIGSNNSKRYEKINIFRSNVDAIFFASAQRPFWRRYSKSTLSSPPEASVWVEIGQQSAYNYRSNDYWSTYFEFCMMNSLTKLRILMRSYILINIIWRSIIFVM